MIQLINEYWNIAQGMLGFSPVLMVPVFLLVSIISRVLKVRSRWPDWKNLILGVLCIIVSGFIGFTIEFENFQQLAQHSIILGSVSALSYQIFKGVYSGIKSWVEKAFEEKTGVDIDVEGEGDECRE